VLHVLLLLQGVPIEELSEKIGNQHWYAAAATATLNRFTHGSQTPNSLQVVPLSARMPAG